MVDHQDSDVILFRSPIIVDLEKCDKVIKARKKSERKRYLEALKIVKEYEEKYGKEESND